MSYLFLRGLCLVIGYCFGLIQTAFIYGKLNGIDIRQHGSGNSGTTNALRVMGKKAGAICFLGDGLKPVFAMLLIQLTLGRMFPEVAALLRMYTGAGVILGHNFPFYMHFKGGKGIMATGGMSIGMGYQTFLATAITFFAVFALSNYVSLGSLCMYVAFVTSLIIKGQCGLYGMAQPFLNEMYVIGVLLLIMAFVQHRGNIGRLIHGNERKTYIFKKNKSEEPKEETK